ncbi:hypothetical protein D3C72_2142590 [compost metagenome]
MGARLAIEQTDLTEPLWRFDQRQQRLLAFAANCTDAHAARQHRIQATRCIAPLEQVLPGCQFTRAGQFQQTILKQKGQVLEPVPLEQGGPPGGISSHIASTINSVG